MNSDIFWKKLNKIKIKMKTSLYDLNCFFYIYFGNDIRVHSVKRRFGIKPLTGDQRKHTNVEIVCFSIILSYINVTDNIFMNSFSYICFYIHLIFFSNFFPIFHFIIQYSSYSSLLFSFSCYKFLPSSSEDIIIFYYMQEEQRF